MSAAWPRRSRIRARLPEQVRELAGLLLEQIAVSTRRYADWRRMCHQRPPGRRGGAPHDDTGGRANHSMALHQPSHRRWRAFGAGATAPQWLGLVPWQLTTGGKPKLGKISKMGQRDLRRLLITGAMSVVRNAARRCETTDPWLASMLARKPRMLVAVALANRMARITWAHDEEGELPGSPASPERAKRGKPSGCEKVGGQVKGQTSQMRGIGKTSSWIGALKLAYPIWSRSACISIQASGVQQVAPTGRIDDST